MDVVIVPVLKVLLAILELYKFFLFIYIILGWLEHFNVVNKYNSFVYAIHNFLFSIIEPGLRPIRRIIPTFGLVDLSPIILIISIYFIEEIIFRILIRFPS